MLEQLPLLNHIIALNSNISKIDDFFSTTATG